MTSRTEMQYTDKKPSIFPAKDIDSHAKGWIVDLSPADIVNPDCYWKFSSKRKAEQFVEYLAETDPRTAAHLVNMK